MAEKSEKITYKDVLAYFDGVSDDLAELVYNMVGERLKSTKERREKQLKTLAKARQAKARKEAETETAEAAAPQPQPQAQDSVAEETQVAG